jgi:hypothetical protein
MDRGRPSDLVATSSFAADPASFDSDFIPLPYGTGENTTIEDADLVHVEVPASALAALGLPVEGLSGRVQAVVALGADGVLQGIQIVQ